MEYIFRLSCFTFANARFFSTNILSTREFLRFHVYIPGSRCYRSLPTGARVRRSRGPNSQPPMTRFFGNSFNRFHKNFFFGLSTLLNQRHGRWNFSAFASLFASMTISLSDNINSVVIPNSCRHSLSIFRQPWHYCLLVQILFRSRS